MLTSLRIQGFKAWRDSGPMRLAPLTVIFGENGSGKSSLSQLLRAMRQTVEAGWAPHDLLLGGEGADLELGTFADVAHLHRTENPIEIRLTLTDAEGAAAFTIRAHAPPEAELARSVAAQKEDEEEDEEDEGARELEARLARFASRVIHLGPFRELPPREVRAEETRRVGALGERALAALAAHRDAPIELGGARRPLLEHVDAWLGRVGLASSLELAPLANGGFEPRVRLRPGSVPLRLTSAGSGLVHLLPVIVQCLLAPEGTCLILEQPELHLHPGVQAELADLFVEVTRGGRLQLLVESHSELLLQRLQRRVGEGALGREGLALHHVRREEDEARAVELRLDARGNLLTWPERFFGDPIGDLLVRTELSLGEDEG